jgi:hypothetical protein
MTTSITNKGSLMLKSILFITLLLSGCAPDDTTPKVVTNAPPQVAHGLDARMESLPEPNKYKVKLKWRGLDAPSPLYLYRGNQKTLQQVTQLTPALTQYEDATVQAGETYQYFITTIENGGPVNRASASVDIPRDLELRGNAVLKSMNGFNRLFLYRDTVLTTLGKDTALQVNEIISDDATLQSFPSGQKAPSGQNGRTGGSIDIRAKRGSGRLHIFARGESGGDGLDGLPGSAGANGIQGQAGDWGINTDLYNYLNRSFVDSYGNLMRRFPKPPENPEWNTVFAGRPLYICARPATNGLPGGNGTAAQDGGSGGNGGNSAKAVVRIKEDSDFQVDITVEPGLSGIGGRPGKGGLGGPGGAPGALDQGHKCPPAQTGPMGQNGIDGRQGRPGDYGVKQPVCVTSGNSTQYECDKFKE